MPRFRPEDFIDPWIDPNAPLVSVFPPDEFLKAAALDPGLVLAELNLPIDQIGRFVARRAINNVLKQQQYLVYDMATNVGVLQPYVGVTESALQFFDVLVSQLSTEVVAKEAIETAIGACGRVLSAIPTIYTQIAGAVISLGVTISQAITGSSDIPPRAILPCQQWSEETDEEQFNGAVRAVTSEGYDWTSIYMPRYSGDLTMMLCKQAETGHLAMVWGLGDGQVPKVYLDSNSIQFENDGVIQAGGGLGMIPGGQRIYGVLQSTVLDMRGEVARDLQQGDAIRFDKGHPTVFDPRCGGYDILSIDVGTFYPTSAQASMSLWDFMFQRGAAMFAVNTFDCAVAWTQYFEALMDGVQLYWGDSGYMGRGGRKDGFVGWGQGVWENTLSDLLQNYSVDSFGNIGGGIGAFTQPYCSEAFTDANRADFYKSSTINQIILPALSRLHYIQQWFLEHTTIAAYLPIEGGVDADPLAQPSVMGAFRGNTIGTQNMRKLFVDARRRIRNGAQKFDVRLSDVLDPVYRAQIEDAGGGTQSQELGLVAAAPGELPWTPTGGAGYFYVGATPPPPDHDRALWVGATAVAVGGAAWLFRDDIRRFVSGVRQRVARGRGRRR